MLDSGKSHASMEERSREHSLVQGVRGQRRKRGKIQTELTQRWIIPCPTHLSVWNQSGLGSKDKDLRNAAQISDSFLLEKVF